MEVQQCSCQNCGVYSHPSLSPVLLCWIPVLPFLLQGGASRAAEVSSRWAGEFGHGGPSGRGLREAQGSLQSLHWRGSETGQVRSSTGGSTTVSHSCQAQQADPSCLSLTVCKSLLFTKYVTFCFYMRKNRHGL